MCHATYDLCPFLSSCCHSVLWPIQLLAISASDISKGVTQFSLFLFPGERRQSVQFDFFFHQQVTDVKTSQPLDIGSPVDVFFSERGGEGLLLLL